jgi:hypothetical protein
MTGILPVVAATATALGIVAGAVLVGHDTTLLVSPPEAVAESFVRDLVARRNELAMEYVDGTSGVSITTVRLGADALRRDVRDAVAGDVHGDRVAIEGDRATARVTIDAPDGTAAVIVEMRRTSEGVWRITGWKPA